MYPLATVHSITDRQIDDSMTPIANTGYNLDVT